MRSVSQTAIGQLRISLTGLLAIGALVPPVGGNPHFGAWAASASRPADPTICMSLTAGDGDDVVRIDILVPPAETPTLLASGYKVVPCASVFGSAAEQQAWRDTICELASDPRESFPQPDHIRAAGPGEDDTTLRQSGTP